MRICRTFPNKANSWEAGRQLGSGRSLKGEVSWFKSVKSEVCLKFSVRLMVWRSNLYRKNNTFITIKQTPLPF